MKKFGKILLTNLCFGVVMFVIGLLTSPPKTVQGAPGSAPVTVVNTPLPVSGNVTGTVTGSVNIANTPLPVTGSVNVANTPLPVTGNVTGSVAVINPTVQDLNNNPAPGPLITEDTANPGYEPFSISLCIANNGPFVCSFPDPITVPSKTADNQPVTRLVIEHVSGECVVTGGTIAVLNMHTSSSYNGGDVGNHFPLSPNSSPAGGWYVFAQSTRIYADPGTGVSIDPDYPGATPNYWCVASVNGYFVVAAKPTVF